MKGKIASIINDGDTYYIKVKRFKDIKIIFCKFLSELNMGEQMFFEDEYDYEIDKVKIFNYDEHIDEYALFKDKGFKVHTIFGKNYLHFIIVTKNRDKLDKALRKYFDFVKSK